MACEDLEGKFGMIERWVAAARLEVLMIDTANDFFRGDDNPSEEGTVGTFFDRMRSLPLAARIMVRHDRKRREADGELHSNERIRGSSEWKEDPEIIASLERLDRRTNEVDFEIGKLRYGTKPEPMRLWFDAGTFRLVPLSPVIAVLEAGRQRREQIVGACKARFGLEQRLVDAMLHEQNSYLRTAQEGHKRAWEIDPDRAREAPWFAWYRPTSEASVQDMQSSKAGEEQAKEG